MGGKILIKSINIIQYRKLKNLDLEFSDRLNAISGTNGTCKTSLLHLIGNSLQAPTKKCDKIINEKCLPIIKAVNSVTNPKVESLTRGDTKYNDPAYGLKGHLFSVDYYNDSPTLEFRRHNASNQTRYSVKPKYKKGTEDSLPYCPVIYLGLSRLLPYGEFQNDEALAGIKKILPIEYQDEIAEIYKKFTNYQITYKSTQQMGDIKIRSEFSSNIEGIDSNTISAGEDNLYIILTALVSLKYYFQSINSTDESKVESVLLIDELDATLHPAFQIKLLNLFREMSSLYKIQIVFTTHSMSLLEEMLDKKDNVIYLYDNISSVVQMHDLDIYKIKMHLQSLTHENIYADKVIPIFTEDEEARTLLEIIFDYFSETQQGFTNARRFFHFVKANIGAENLTNIFSDDKILHTTIRSICILDGDKNFEMSNCVISLPGGRAPEKLLVDYAEKLLAEDDRFWVEKAIIERGYGKHYYIENIQQKVSAFEKELSECKESGDSTKGRTRQFNKDLFRNNKTFFKLLFKHWLNNVSNKSAIDKFYNNLKALFKKISHYHEINPNEWM